MYCFYENSLTRSRKFLKCFHNMQTPHSMTRKTYPKPHVEDYEKYFKYTLLCMKSR